MSYFEELKLELKRTWEQDHVDALGEKVKLSDLVTLEDFTAALIQTEIGCRISTARLETMPVRTDKFQCRAHNSDLVETNIRRSVMRPLMAIAVREHIMDAQFDDFMKNKHYKVRREGNQFEITTPAGTPSVDNHVMGQLDSSSGHRRTTNLDATEAGIRPVATFGERVGISNVGVGLGPHKG